MIDQGEFFDIDSPCKRICELNNRGYCKGCFRSRDERLYWNQFSTHQKQQVVNLCEKRRLKVLASKNATEVLEDEPSIEQLDLFLVAETATVSSLKPSSLAESSKPFESSKPISSKPLGDQFDLF